MLHYDYVMERQEMLTKNISSKNSCVKWSLYSHFWAQNLCNLISQDLLYRFFFKIFSFMNEFMETKEILKSFTKKFSLHGKWAFWALNSAISYLRICSRISQFSFWGKLGPNVGPKLQKSIS